MNPSARCHYEVIPTYRPAKLYLDLEFYVDRNPEADAEKAASTFVRAVCSALHSFYNIQVSSADILVLDASTQKKFSQHVVFNSPSTAFENNLEQGHLIRLVCHALAKAAADHTFKDPDIFCANIRSTQRCASCTEAIDKLVYEAFPAFEITPLDAKHCFMHSSFEEEAFISICDSGVYTRNRNFRLAGSHKLTGVSVLWPIGLDRGPSLDLVWPNWRAWASTLVTWLDSRRNYVLLRHPVPKCQCASHVSCQPVRGAAAHWHSPVSSSYSQNLPPGLCDFVRTVLTDWLLRGQQASPKTAGDFVASKKWRIHHLDAHCFSVTLDGLRFCERVGRSHRSNHVILVFDLSQRIYYQKCLDPDCRAVNFRSQSRPMPLNLCATSSGPRQTANSFNDPDVTDDDLILCGVTDMVDVYFADNF
ncbi:Coiled-coil domain-containing protein [Paragonimus heterotremus]|uniref:DNA-directed primase/polymerase protein n=1 Tax=Paragonimus heterotremus TaxID=100268 RepID=A0A8J4TAG1_9TREM|nr:Coiled-coil domain-containing protein [Paragonimus heterotremus]